MAIKQGSEAYTKWMHVENGRVLVRRIHRMEVQAHNGRLYVLRAENLPDYIGTFTGEGHKGEHLAQILLSPKTITRNTAYVAAETRSWPTFRDVVNVGMGFLLTVMLKFVVSVVSGCP